ncbi:MAG: valine--tRNA ligase [Calditrichia bacterium]|nr:valine--tRNA ligase [Calditrichia bacterium]
MRNCQIDKIYDPKKVEDKWYDFWLKKNYFAASPNKDKKPYVIVIPPPNVTDILHAGHAFNNTIQDIYIRYKRKKGFETLWQPGTDHAGIATQNVVERSLAKENITRHDLGREKFVEKVWEWREKYGSTIIHQLKKLGCSCDWSRERFTMDYSLSNAVKEIFVRLYEKDLIYKGKYIINWCPRCSTALSDEEVEHRESAGQLWYFMYPYKDKHGTVVVATTRPETMLGDTAVAVNPKDKRYKHLIGKTLILPLMDRKIPVVADEFVDPEFGTGAVKVTPAHDPNDFLIGERHNLEQINILNPDGTLNDNAGQFAGADRFVARNQVIQEMKNLGYLEKVTSHHHNVGHCHRCNTMIEPYLSEQWFVKVKPLAKPALQVVKYGKVRFHPHDRWYRTYEHWMENVRDWCISRQLWWGHRIPVYYCDDCKEMMVLREIPEKCTKCDSSNIRQDEDVLDTWFSSWLWPFSTQGWPEQTEDLKYFYPTDLLVTGPDIIFFWVARMIMAGLEFMEEVPFHDVLLNGIVRDEHGKKMSKSLGNGIDPLEMIEQFSADAVRFTLIILSSEGQDINLSTKHFEMGRNFSNKIWNAYRFLSMHFKKVDTDFEKYQDHFELADQWILSSFQKTIEATESNLNRFRVNESLNVIYQFFWHNYCDWYLELIKKRLYADESDSRKAALSIAAYIMKETMSVMHPFIPFITEEVWQAFKNRHDESIVIQSWPQVLKNHVNDSVEKKMVFIQSLIGAIRNIRAEMNVPPGKDAPLYVRSNDAVMDMIKRYKEYFSSLAKVEDIFPYSTELEETVTATAVVEGTELFIPLADLIDIEKEKERLHKEMQRLQGLEKSISGKLSNQNFISKAPEAVVTSEKDKLAKIQESLKKVTKNYQKLL